MISGHKRSLILTSKKTFCFMTEIPMISTITDDEVGQELYDLLLRIIIL
jgi:hypothetical protein